METVFTLTHAGALLVLLLILAANWRGARRYQREIDALDQQLATQAAAPGEAPDVAGRR
ncbi:hypothetical protein [Paucibacter sp. B51]|nr:hypothetical protein [Paucibacter sp. B51]